MEEPTAISLKSVAMKYGVISALIGIIIFVLIDFSGLSGNQAIGYLQLLVVGAIMYFAHKEFIKEGDGYMNYSQGLGLGTLMVLISSLISNVFVFIYVQYINTNFLPNLLDIQRQAMEEQGMSDEQIEQAMSFTQNIMSPVGFFIIGIVSSVFFGFIISLVVSAITKKSRPEFE